MTSIRKGLTLPNREWDKYSQEELDALYDLRPETLVWLLYGTDIDIVHQTQLQPFFDQNLDVKVIYRPYRDDIPKWNPVDWARECWRRVGRMTARLVPAEVICDNERNLAVEHGNEDWNAHIWWLEAWSSEWKSRLGLTMKVHMGALSPSGNYRAGMSIYKESGVYKYFDVIDAHVYGDPRIVSLPQTIQPICITEFNLWLPSDMIIYYKSAATDVVWFILGGTKDQSAYDILKLPNIYASFKDTKIIGGQDKPMATIPADYTSPNHEGPRSKTTGIVLHATLSGKLISFEQEYESTCNYLNNPKPEGDPAKAVSAHAVVHLGSIHYPVQEDRVAWHCLTWNHEKLGIELVKPQISLDLPASTLDTAAKQCARWCIKYNIPAVWSPYFGIEEHRNMPNNNHQDVGGPFDRDDFMKRVKYHMANLQGVPIVNGPTVTLGPATKKVVLDDLDFLWAYSSATQTSRNPQEAEKVMRERIVGLKVALGLNG